MDNLSKSMLGGGITGLIVGGQVSALNIYTNFTISVAIILVELLVILVILHLYPRLQPRLLKECDDGAEITVTCCRHNTLRRVKVSADDGSEAILYPDNSLRMKVAPGRRTFTTRLPFLGSEHTSEIHISGGERLFVWFPAEDDTFYDTDIQLSGDDAARTAHANMLMRRNNTLYRVLILMVTVVLIVSFIIQYT